MQRLACAAALQGWPCLSAAYFLTLTWSAADICKSIASAYHRRFAVLHPIMRLPSFLWCLAAASPQLLSHIKNALAGLLHCLVRLHSQQPRVCELSPTHCCMRQNISTPVLLSYCMA